MTAIVVNYEPFVMNQTIARVTDEGQTFVELKCSHPMELAEAIIAECYTNDIYDVRVRANANMIDELSSYIRAAERNSYAANKITVGAI